MRMFDYGCAYDVEIGGEQVCPVPTRWYAIIDNKLQDYFFGCIVAGSQIFGAMSVESEFL